jgi:hypothetical protein
MIRDRAMGLSDRRQAHCLVGLFRRRAHAWIASGADSTQPDLSPGRRHHGRPSISGWPPSADQRQCLVVGSQVKFSGWLTASGSTNATTNSLSRKFWLW